VPKKKKSVLFVCTANRYRSPFAEAAFLQRLEKDGKVEEWRVGSAGTWTKADLPAMPRVLQQAQEFGLDLGEHRSVEVDREVLSEYALTIVMEIGHKEALQVEFSDMSERIFLLSEIVDSIAYDIPDPAKAMKDADEIISELYTLIQRGYAAICALVDEML